MYRVRGYPSCSSKPSIQRRRQCLRWPLSSSGEGGCKAVGGRVGRCSSGFSSNYSRQLQSLLSLVMPYCTAVQWLLFECLVMPTNQPTNYLSKQASSCCCHAWRTRPTTNVVVFSVSHMLLHTALFEGLLVPSSLCLTAANSST